MMSSMAKSIRKTERVLKENSPALFASTAALGVAASLYLTARATWRAAEDIRNVEGDTGPTQEDPKELLQYRASLVWKHYIPPAVATTATFGCIFGCLKSGNRKTAVAMTAYSLSERAFKEYKDKVVDQIGLKEEEKIRDDIAQQAVTQSPPGEVIVTGGGEVLCCELYTRRYFESDMQTLRKAQNDVNSVLNNELYATLSDFYYIVGLTPTSESSAIGWDSDRLMELDFSTVLAEDGRPCLAFSYNYTKVL